MWHDMSGWDWLWGSLMMTSWVVVLALVVFIAVKLAQNDRRGGSS
jgi:hypothetical protein